MSDHKLPTLSGEMLSVRREVLSTLVDACRDFKCYAMYDHDGAKLREAEAVLALAPHPWLIELASWIESEKTALPVSGTALVYLGTEWFWRLGDKGAWPHATELFGPLPPRGDDTPNEVTIEEIRAAREWVKQQEGNDVE